MSSHLPRLARSGYGVADLGISGALLLTQLYLFELYTRVVGLSPVLVGTAVALAIAWDAVSDPIMGIICDRTRTRLGRFIPYLIAGAVVLPIALFALFSPPAMSEPIGFAYLLITYLAFNTAITILGVPHLALAGALTQESEVRTELYGWRLIFGTVGLLLGVGAPLIVGQGFGFDPATEEGLGRTRSGAGILIGLATALSVGLTLAATWRYGRSTEALSPFTWGALRETVHSVFRNPLFRVLFFAFFLVSLGRAMNGIIALPYYKYSLLLPEADVQKWVLGLFALCIAGSVPLWLKLSARYGKKWPGFTGMLTLGVMTTIAYPLFPEKQLWGPLIAALIGGIAVGAIILFESMVTDVADEDRLESGEAREGIYFGFWRMGQKLSSSVGVLLTGFILELIGYEEGVGTQPEHVERGLAWLFGPGVGVFFIAGACFVALSPLNKRRQDAIQEAIHKQSQPPAST
ncbi:MAG: MFS transporter [Opitutales bacterium]